MLKRCEVSLHNSCLNKAKDDEMIFVLLARDAAAPATVRHWAKMRVNLGLNKENDDKILEALSCAYQMEKQLSSVKADTIGGFTIVSPNCGGCGKPLLVENAWMTDGCPYNCVLGTNSLNETRWRLLMQLQQQQSMELADLKAKH